MARIIAPDAQQHRTGFDTDYVPNNPLLVATEEVAGVDLALDVIKACVVAVSDDRLAHGLELLKVADDVATVEGGARGQGRLVDNHGRILGHLFGHTKTARHSLPEKVFG